MSSTNRYVLISLQRLQAIHFRVVSPVHLDRPCGNKTQFKVHHLKKKISFSNQDKASSFVKSNDIQSSLIYKTAHNRALS